MADSSALNAVYSSLRMKRRYEVWFLRCGLADGSGAWWFRYLTLNLGRKRIDEVPAAMPAQVWATWFPRGGTARTFIQGFPLEDLDLSARREVPFHCRIAESGIEEGKCWGNIEVDGQAIAWKLQFHSQFGAVLSDKGWIGFSRSPHSNAAFSGEILLNGMRFAGDPLGFGVQGHNCGYRHRTYWRWTHAYFPQAGGQASTLEALVYDLPLGLTFRNAILWHRGAWIQLRKISEREVVHDSTKIKWVLAAQTSAGETVEATIEGAAPELHQLPYLRTDASGTFPVSNASLASAMVKIGDEVLQTPNGAVLEMGGAS